MAGVDAAIKRRPIDPNRLGITGWSYGGFMTMWAVNANEPVPRGHGWRGSRQLAELLRRK